MSKILVALKICIQGCNLHVYFACQNTQVFPYCFMPAVGCSLSVDGIPIRQFANNEAAGVPYLSKQAMRIYSSIWDGEEWATRGGLEKIDWGSSPFIASYGGYKLDACDGGRTTLQGSSCPAGKWWNEETYNTLDYTQQGQLSWVHRFFLIYDYCTDSSRYPKPPIECTLDN